MILGVIIPENGNETLGKILNNVYPVVFNPLIGEITYRGTVSDFEIEYLSQIEKVQISRWINKDKELIISEGWMNHYDIFESFKEDCIKTDVDIDKDIIVVLDINKSIA